MMFIVSPTETTHRSNPYRKNQEINRSVSYKGQSKKHITKLNSKNNCLDKKSGGLSRIRTGDLLRVKQTS